TEVFWNHRDVFDQESATLMKDRAIDNMTRYTATVEESKEINSRHNGMPKIIISASGMCDAGRIKHHLKHNLWRPESTVLFVGYQARGTLGRSLVDGAKRVRIFGEEISVKARIEMFEGFSGHADREGLLSWLGAMRHKPARVLLIHGEKGSIESLAETIHKDFHIDVTIPEYAQSVTLGLEVADKRLAVMETGRYASLAAVHMLEILREEFASTMESLHRELKRAATEEEISVVTARIQDIENRLKLSETL
ncbi:MAG TPA: MBL fold hydrolase, partial [Clostridiales bacterium]|nr:MBL fold hydrolase [Clostridiales bacterium]